MWLSSILIILIDCGWTYRVWTTIAREAMWLQLRVFFNAIDVRRGSKAITTTVLVVVVEIRNLPACRITMIKTACRPPQITDPSLNTTAGIKHSVKWGSELIATGAT